MYSKQQTEQSVCSKLKEYTQNSCSILRKNKKLSLSFSFLFSLFLILGLYINPASSQIPKIEAEDVLQELSNVTASVGSYQGKLHLLIQDPQFLREFFWTPDAGTDYKTKTSVSGFLSGTGGGTIAGVFINYNNLDYQTFNIDGSKVSYVGLRRYKNIYKSTKKYKKVNYAALMPAKLSVPEPLPSPSEEEQTQSLPEGVPDYSKTAENYKDLDPRLNENITFHPLAFIVPYILQSRSNQDTYKILSEKDKFLGVDCLVLQIVEHQTKNITKVWLDMKKMQILQVEYHDIKTNCKLNAMYLGFHKQDKDSRFAIYNRVQVQCNGNPVYIAELNDPIINIIEKKTQAANEKQEKKDERSRTISELISTYTGDPEFLTDTAKKGVCFLGILLFFFAIRFIFFRTSRHEFDDELIVVDEEDGRFAEMLTKMGYKTTPFTPDVIAEERQYLGKGWTKDTTYRSRAVVITPDSFQFVRSNLYLIKAYVEEGGRVMVMYHPQSSNSTLPYTVEQVPLAKGNQGYFFEYKTDTITNVKSDNVKRLVQTYAGPEIMLTVNGKKFNERLIWCVNSETKMEATIAGMVKYGKGEYIICQMQFTPAVTVKNANLQFMLNDLFRYLLGLEAIKTE